jgi:hypothetical protein
MMEAIEILDLIWYVVQLSVELGYVFLIFRLQTSKRQCLVHFCQFY